MGTVSPLIVTTIDRGFASLEAKKEKSDCGLISVLFVSYEYGLGVNSENVTRAHWLLTSAGGPVSYAIADEPTKLATTMNGMIRKLSQRTISPLFIEE